MEIRCWLTTSHLADLKSRLGTACARAVDLAVRQGFPGSVAGDDALGLLEQLSGFPQATPGPRSWRGLKISLHNFPPTKVPTRARESIADILGVSAVAATAGMNQHMHEYLYQLTSAHLRCKASLPAWGGAGATSYPFWAQTLTLFLQRCHRGEASWGPAWMCMVDQVTSSLCTPAFVGDPGKWSMIVDMRTRMSLNMIEDLHSILKLIC